MSSLENRIDALEQALAQALTIVDKFSEQYVANFDKLSEQIVVCVSGLTSLTSSFNTLKMRVDASEQVLTSSTSTAHAHKSYEEFQFNANATVFVPSLNSSFNASTSVSASLSSTSTPEEDPEAAVKAIIDCYHQAVKDAMLDNCHDLDDLHESDENPSVESGDFYDEDDDFEKFEFEYRQMHGNDAFEKLGLP